MDYARQQRDPTRHAIGIAFVVLVHAFVIYALMTGLARQVDSRSSRSRSIATIIEEIEAAASAAAAAEEDRRAAEGAAAVETFVPPPDVPVPRPRSPPTPSPR